MITRDVDGQSRVFFSMSKRPDPKIFSSVNPRTQTPAKIMYYYAFVVCLLHCSARVVGEMTSIGTLFAFILVFIGYGLCAERSGFTRSLKHLVPLVPILVSSLFIHDGVPANGT